MFISGLWVWLKSFLAHWKHPQYQHPTKYHDISAGAYSTPNSQQAEWERHIILIVLETLLERVWFFPLNMSAYQVSWQHPRKTLYECGWLYYLYPLEKIKHFNCRKNKSTALQHPSWHKPIRSCFQPAVFFNILSLISAPKHVLRTIDQPSKPIESFMLLRHLPLIRHCRCNIFRYSCSQTTPRRRVFVYRESGFNGHR